MVLRGKISRSEESSGGPDSALDRRHHGETFLSIENLFKSYTRGEVVVHGISLEARAGEIIVLLGPSGCGKTTTLRCIAGFEHPDSGQITIGGRIVNGPSKYLPPDARNIGMVFQNYGIWPHMTVAENVAFPLKIRKLARHEVTSLVENALRIVGLESLSQRSASSLSGGQQQRVALARAMVYKPDLLLLDEPLSNLDAETRNSLRFELRAIQESIGVTAVYVTHDQSEAAILGDRVAVMNNGLIEQFGSAESIYNHPESEFVARFTGVENILSGNVRSSTNLHAIVETTAGTTLSGYFPNANSQKSKTQSVLIIIRAENVVLNPVQPTLTTGSLSGSVTSLDFIGLQSRYGVTLISGEKVYARELGTVPRFRLGDGVEVIFPADRTTLLPVIGV
jgi:iron(III) transport system ATP-binding protein